MSPHPDTQSALTLAGIRQYLSQPRYAQTLELLLLSEVGGVSRVNILERDAPLPVISFEVQDANGTVCRCRCNPSAFALLLLIIVCGQSVFINYASGRPYVKVFGRKDKKAGTVFARLLVEAEAEEDYTYANGDTLNFTFANIEFGRRNPRTANDLHANYGEIAFAAADTPDALFQGDEAHKVQAATALLRAVLERMAEERELAISA